MVAETAHVDGLSEMGGAQVRVSHRRRNITMSQDLLDAHEIHVGHDASRRCGMPE